MRGLSELSDRQLPDRSVRPLIRRLRRHLLPRGEKDQSLTARSRSAFITTLTEDSAIAPAAMAGDSRMPNAG